MYKWPLLMQTASITGTYGITFVIIMFNAVAAEFFMLYYGNYKLQNTKYNQTVQTAKLLGMLFVLMLFHGLIQYDKNRKDK